MGKRTHCIEHQYFFQYCLYKQSYSSQKYFVNKITEVGLAKYQSDFSTLKRHILIETVCTPSLLFKGITPQIINTKIRPYTK